MPALPTVNAGDYLISSATIEPLVGDLVPINNTSTVNQMVVNAYDPKRQNGSTWTSNCLF